MGPYKWPLVWGNLEDGLPVSFSILISMVSFRPLRIGLWDPFQMAMKMAYMGVILTTYDTWDDSPSRPFLLHALTSQILPKFMGHPTR